jgi:DEAD_2
VGTAVEESEWMSTAGQTLRKRIGHRDIEWNSSLLYHFFTYFSRIKEKKIQNSFQKSSSQTNSNRSGNRGSKVEKFIKDNPDVNTQPMDIEDLVRVGGARGGPCPYFLARNLASTSEIIFLPYNYLVDPVTRTGLKIDWQDCIMIFDEAHNVTVCLEIPPLFIW